MLLSIVEISLVMGMIYVVANIVAMLIAIAIAIIVIAVDSNNSYGNNVDSNNSYSNRMQNEVKHMKIFGWLRRVNKNSKDV